MPRLDIQKAKRAGYTDQEIQSFAAQNPDLSLFDSAQQSTASASSSQQTQQTPDQVPQQNSLLSFLGGIQNAQGPTVPVSPLVKSLATGALNLLPGNRDMATARGLYTNGGRPDLAQNFPNEPQKQLPAMGAIAGEGLAPGGGPASAGVGASGGKVLQNILEGKPMWQDLAATGEITAALGLGGKVVGGLLGKVLGKFGEDAAVGPSNMGGRVGAKFTTETGVSGPELLRSNNAAGANTGKLEQVIDDAHKTYNAAADRKDIPLRQEDFIKNVNNLKERILGKANDIVPEGAKNIWNSVYSELKSSVFPKLGITEAADGSLATDSSVQPTLHDAVQGKRAFDGVTRNGQFKVQNPMQWSANRAAGDVMRDTLNDSADAAGLPDVKQQGINLRNLHIFQDMAEGRVGVGQSVFGWQNIMKKGAGALIGSLIPGVGPLGGVAGETIAEEALKNPSVAGPLSGILSGMGKAAQSIPASAVGATALSGVNALRNLLFPGMPTGNSQEDQSNSYPLQNGPSQSEGNINGNKDTIGHNDQSISQGNILGNILGLNSTPTSSAPKSTSSMIPSGQSLREANPFYNSQSKQVEVPNPNQIQNVIPNQPYPQEYQQYDLQRAAGNPIAIAQIAQKAKQNQDYINQYQQQFGLSDPDRTFMDNASQTNQKMETLRGLIGKKEGRNIFEALWNSSPAVWETKIKTDPQAAQMAQLMTQLGFAGARQAEGGRPSNYDVTTLLGIGPTKEDTAASALAKLDMLQHQMGVRVKELSPRYHLMETTPEESAKNTQSLPDTPQQPQTIQLGAPTGAWATPDTVPGKGGGQSMMNSPASLGQGGGKPPAMSSPLMAYINRLGSVADQRGNVSIPQTQQILDFANKYLNIPQKAKVKMGPMELLAELRGVSQQPKPYVSVEHV